MNMQYLWLAVGIVGILGAIVPAAQMGTDIYFDFQLFMLVEVMVEVMVAVV